MCFPFTKVVKFTTWLHPSKLKCRYHSIGPESSCETWLRIFTFSLWGICTCAQGEGLLHLESGSWWSSQFHLSSPRMTASAALPQCQFSHMKPSHGDLALAGYVLPYVVLSCEKEQQRQTLKLNLRITKLPHPGNEHKCMRHFTELVMLQAVNMWHKLWCKCVVIAELCELL